MPISSYRTVARDATAEIEEGRSRFRCSVARVGDEAGVHGFIDMVRREHWDARHHCSAYVLGPGRMDEGSNDDGEPPGTAAGPMLDALRGRELSDVVVVVSRWFGGTLLGTGRLARAYAAATRAALDEAGLAERVLQDLCEVRLDIAAVGKLEHELRSRGAHVLGVEYTDEAWLHLAIPSQVRAVTEEIVAELTSGAAELRVIGREWVDADG